MTIEAVLTVLVNTQRRSRCRSCHARLTWYQTQAGSWIPFDGSPQLDNVRRDITSSSRPWIGEITRHATHWRTCPDAVSWRKG